MDSMIMLKKQRKYCRRGLTHLDATPTFKKSFERLMGQPAGHFLINVFVPLLLLGLPKKTQKNRRKKIKRKKLPNIPKNLAQK